MAKELPYFKFEPSEWDNGNIQMCSRESKGLFIDLCSLYWSRLGELPHALALQKLCNGNKDAMQELLEHEILGVIEGQIVIEFLDEQLQDRGQTSEKRREAAQKRWSDANAEQMQSKCKANRIEEKREEEKKKEENTNGVYVTPLAFDSNEFHDAWQEWFKYRKESGKKLRESTIKKQMQFLGARTESEAIAIINQSIEKGWTGLFDLKKNGKSTLGTKQQQTIDTAKAVAELYGDVLGKGQAG